MIPVNEDDIGGLFWEIAMVVLQSMFLRCLDGGARQGVERIGLKRSLLSSLRF